MHLRDLVEAQADRDPGRAFLVHGGEVATYGEVDDRADRLARGLKEEGVGPGDRVVALLDNGLDYGRCYFAVQKVGAVWVALNTQTTASIVAYHLRDCQAKAVICHHSTLPLVEAALSEAPGPQLVVVAGQGAPGAGARTVSLDDLAGAPGGRPAPCDPEALASIIYTSGTTGRPKGVMLSSRNLLANTRSIVAYLGLTSEDRVMAVLSFYYSYGNSLLLTHALVGGQVVIDNRFAFPNLVLKTMADQECTGFAGVPSHFVILLNRSGFARMAFPHLRYITQAGGPMAPVVQARLRELLPQVSIYIMYGQTEASARLTYLPPEALEARLGSVGVAIPGVDLRILDEGGREVSRGEAGEIVARGENIMMGYWNDPGETAKVLRPEGLRTGDLGRMDQEGYITIVGRHREMIKSGAHRISPKEVEEVLAGHPQVQEAAVVGVADEIMGEVIRAYLVLRPGEILEGGDFKRFMRQSLPSFKVPREVRVVDILPRTSTGKLRREALREVEGAEVG